MPCHLICAYLSIFMSLQFHGVKHSANLNKMRDFLCLVSTTGEEWVLPEIRRALDVFLTVQLIISGEKFRVMHDVCVKRHQSTPDTEVAFLCLLCERRLSNQECYAHTFSREHVATFLVSILIPNTSQCMIFPSIETDVVCLQLDTSNGITVRDVRFLIKCTESLCQQAV